MNLNADARVFLCASLHVQSHRFHSSSLRASGVDRNASAVGGYGRNPEEGNTHHVPAAEGSDLASDEHAKAVPMNGNSIDRQAAPKPAKASSDAGVSEVGNETHDPPAMKEKKKRVTDINQDAESAQISGISYD